MSGQYHRPHRWAWWTERPGYRRFMIRELTSVFMAGYLVVFVMTLASVGGGEAVFAEWIEVPQAMPVFLGEKRLPGPVAQIVMGYGPWLTVTAVIVWWVLR